MTATLTTTRYVEIGTYIGQYFLPGAGGLPNNVRIPCLVGKGDRTFKYKNLSFLRSFVEGETLSFTKISPFISNLNHISNGAQAAPARLYTLDGVAISPNKWSFVKDTNGNYTKVQILDTAFDPLTQYSINYQSLDRSVTDEIPIITMTQLSTQAQVRQILALGTTQDQQDFKEYVDFFVDFELDSRSAATTNAFLTGGFSPVVGAAGNMGTGVVDISTSAAYSHSYNRLYTFTVVSASGVSPNRLASISWTATPVSSGNAALPATPINPAQQAPTFNIDESDPLTTNSRLLELGVVVDFSFGTSNFNAGDIFYVQASGPGMIEIDPRLTQPNQFTTFSAVSSELQPLSTGTCVIASLPEAYALTQYNLNVRMQVISMSGAPGSRVATFVWSGYGSTLLSGSFTVSELVSGSHRHPLGATGIVVDMGFGVTGFVEDDTFAFNVLAPRIFYKGKESIRNIQFSVGSVTYPAANNALISGGYLADTPEGGYGTWTAETSIEHGRFEINDGLLMFVRNTYLDSRVNPVPSGSRVAVGDKYTMQAMSLGRIDFSLQQEVTQVFSNPTDILMDTTGAVTGTIGADYILVSNTPAQIISLARADGTQIPYAQVPNTPFIRLLSDYMLSEGDLTLIYRWNGAEPDPGQTYYLTAYFLRPNEMYNTPFLFLTPADAEAFLSPSTVRNDLFIGASIAWDYGIKGLICIQVQDADSDSVYTRDDYRTAVNHFLDDKRATDLCVLNYFGALGDSLNIINRANDPFETHESLLYVGCPIGTPVGSELQQGSMVFYSTKTLAVYGNSPAHGTRIMVGATRATRTIKLDDNSTASVTLDGSFVAAAIAALVASNTDPRQTILLNNLTSFDTMDTYTDAENLQLGGNNIIFFYDQGNGVYQIREDITTDPYSSDTLNINQMTQKQYVTRDIRKYMNTAVIGAVFPSASAGVFAIQAALATRLRVLLSSNVIGYYQDASGKVRDISVADTLVFRDPADPTAYNIGYNYFLATTAKRIFGLFTVNLPGGFPS